MSRDVLVGQTHHTATVSLLCAAFSLSRAAFYAARKRTTGAAEPQPEAGTASPATRVTRLPRYATAAIALVAIQAVLKDNPAWGVRKAWAALRRRDICISRKRVWALMHAHGLVLARDREPGETTRGHVAVPLPNRRWAADFTTVWTKRDGVVAVVPTIDCGCRSALAIDVTVSQESPAILASIRTSLDEVFGAPANIPADLELRTDHGPQYTGADCEALSSAWGLNHTFAPVGRPTGNAVVERFIRTMKEEVIWLQDWEDADELRRALDAWRPRYNTQRPHQALNWKTPEEYRAENLGQPHQMAA